MSSFLSLEMENYQGDLTDIIRAGSGSTLSQSDAPLSSWEFASDMPINLSCSAMDDQSNINSDNFFGDPFCNMSDPLLHELNMASSNYFSGAASTSTDDELLRGASGGANIIGCHQNDKVFAEEVPHKSPSCNINMFSRIQISPAAAGNNSPVMAASPSPRGFKAAAMVPNDIINANSSKTSLIDNTGPVQISSPRNLGIKRRKSQAKKVVCIPAPAAPNSRPSGEVVPSDLWAWRKYGQKPIKGSPYPRGYYRCSSSKGCSARKQVERSRTDPNMLVITYTSEHNHPWPTQRNALAGSTRSQPPKANNNAASKTSPSASSQARKTSKEDQKESSNDTLSPTLNVASTSTGIKEEVEDTHEKELQMEDSIHDISPEGFPRSYRPALPDSSGQSDQDFFADLGEIDGDPLDLLFSQGFNEDDHQEKQGKASLDPFSLFDWSRDNNNTTSFGEAKRGL